MTKSGTMPRQRELWLVPNPFTDLTSLKRRPALVISGDDPNSSGHDVIVAAITSNLSSPLPGFDFGNEDVDDGAIKVRSRVLPAKIYTLEQSVLVRYFCRISAELLRRTFAEIDLALGRPIR